MDDPELNAEFDRAIKDLQQRNIFISKPATTLLLTLLDSIQDDQRQSYSPELRRAEQRRVIERLPQSITVISRHFRTNSIDALMVLQFMPRFMSDFCPPFEKPPPYEPQRMPP